MTITDVQLQALADPQVQAVRDSQHLVDSLRAKAFGSDSYAYQKLLSVSLYLDRQLTAIFEADLSGPRK